MTDERLIFEEKAPYLNITVNRPDEGNKFLEIQSLANRLKNTKKEKIPKIMPKKR